MCVFPLILNSAFLSTLLGGGDLYISNKPNQMKSHAIIAIGRIKQSKKKEKWEVGTSQTITTKKSYFFE